MPTRFSKIFHKRHRTVPTGPTHATPVVPVPSPPVHHDLLSRESAPPQLQVEQSASKLAPTKIFKNTLLFASGIATNAGIPWVKLVSESIIQIIQRLDTMNLNQEACQEFDNDVKAFLYIVARNGGRNHDEEIIENFKKRVQSIRVEVPDTQNRFLRFLDAAETRDIITHLRQSLDSAVQLFQTGLQLSLVDSMQEFKEWRAGIENSNSGNVVKKFLSLTYNAKGELKVRTEGNGNVSFTTQGSHFKTAKNYTQHTGGANVTEILENSTVDADGDIDLTTIATGNTGMRWE